MEEIKEQIGDLRAQLQLGNYTLKLAKCSQMLNIVDFCSKTGTKLSLVLDELDKVVDNLIDLEEMKLKALSAPKTTVKILRVLPIISLMLGFLLGVNTFAFFLTPVGVIFVIIGSLLALTGNKVINKMVKGYEMLSSVDFDHNPIIQLCIVKSAVISGNDLLSALKLLNVQGSEALEESTPFSLAGLPLEFQCLKESFQQGRSPIGPINAQISNLRTQYAKQIKVEGEKLGVNLMIPLGACYLPSFLILGVIPVVIAMAMQI